MKINFWQPVPSFHHQGLFSSLIRDPRVEEVRLWVERDLAEVPECANWPELSVPGLEIKRIANQVPDPSRDKVHVFSGFGSHPGVWGAYRRLDSNAACRCYVYAEAPDTIGIKGGLRRFTYRLAWSPGFYGKGVRRFIPRRPLSNLDGLLAVGDRGVDFYRRICDPQVPVVPFDYYDVEEWDSKNDTRWQGYDSRMLLVVGRLIPCKGLDLLLRAFTDVESSFQLKIIGEGPEEARLRALASRLGLSSRVTWQGFTGRGQLQDEYRNARSLLVCSRAEGWGMTVNEALREGCPARVSMMAGAASLVPESWKMEPSVVSIREALLQLVSEGNTESESRMALDCARQTTGEVGAERLLRILR